MNKDSLAGIIQKRKKKENKKNIRAKEKKDGMYLRAGKTKCDGILLRNRRSDLIHASYGMQWILLWIPPKEES